MLRKVIFLLTAVVLAPVAGGCSSAMVAPPTEAPSLSKTGPATTAQPAWKLTWDRWLAAATKEGKVAVGGQMGTEVRLAISHAFKQDYGIDAEFLVGRASDLVPRIATERRAGLYLMDVNLDGISNQLEFKANGFTESLDPVLVLPEILDPKVWIGGNGINFVEKNHHSLTFWSRPTITVVVNKELTNPGEIKSYNDLLNPKWKGKLVLQDPTVGGAGNLVMTVLAWDLMGQDFLRKLAAQEPVITRDVRLQIEWGARGKYPILIAPHSNTLDEFIKAGAPLQIVWPAEGTSLSAGPGALTLMNNTPHPAAARIFINWLLTKNAQEIAARAGGTQSARVDVPADWIEPESRVRPGARYVLADTEESAQRRMETRELAKEIFKDQLK